MGTVDSVARLLALSAGNGGGGGTGGTSNYNDLANKPQINGTTLTGNKTLDELGITADNLNVYTKEETTNAINDVMSVKADTTYVDTQLNLKADKTALGDLSDLSTDDKSSAVAAINEIKAQGVTKEILTQALAAETASREKQDELLQGEIDNKLSPHNIIAGDNVEITQDGGSVTISAQNSPIATLETAGIVRPDGKTISVDSEGIIRAISGGDAVHVIRNNAEEPFILENSELGYYLLDLDSLGTTSQIPGDPKVFQYGVSEDSISLSTVREETTFILLNYHTDIKESQSKGEIPVLTKYTLDITQDSFPSVYVDETTCIYNNGEYRTGFGPSQYFRFAGAEDLPKKLSELQNDTNFINQEELEESLSTKQDKIDGTVATAENLTLERASENAKNITLKVNDIEIGIIPAPKVQFNSATTFVAKEVKSFYEELGLVPETVNGFAWGSASDPAHGDINYLTEENGPYLVLTNMNIETPLDLLGGNVIILKDILSTELPSPELLTIQFNGEDIGQYDGTEPKTINIQAATEEYVKQLISTIQTASFEVVDALPESDIKSNAIYLVPSNISGLNNIYDEYIYVNDKWELIGNTNIDLSQYATKEYVDDKDINSVKYTADNNVELKNHIVTPFGSGLYGSSPENGWTNLAAVKGYNLDEENEIIQTELGSVTLHTNINSKDRPTVETSEGQEQVRYLSDTEIDDKSSSKTTTYSSNKIDSLTPVMLSVPVRLKKDKVYTQEEILAWFNVTSVSDLKLLFTRNNPLFAKFGITLTTLPHYYKMNVEYAAFESANQIKLVFLGLDTSNDEPSRFTIVANLDGTIIESNSNVQVIIEPLSKSSYNDLLDKPTINDVELKDNVSLDDLNLMDKEQVQSAINNVIDDSKPSLTKTYSSSKIESLSGIKVLTGTKEKPIIANDLPIGTYVISGVVQSSQSNTTNITVPKKIYTVDKTDLGAAIWYENPKTSQQTYYEFKLEGNEAPTEKLQTYVTTEYLSSATLDGGTWI